MAWARPCCVRAEPNRPADFLISNEIAVEARLPNQHVVLGADVIALEHDAIRFHRGMQSLIRDLNLRSEDGAGCFVTFRLHRPVLSWKALRSLVKKKLLEIHEAGLDERSHPVASGFRLCFNAYTTPRVNRFTYGGYVDREANGWLVHTMLTNAQSCSDDKWTKVAPVHHKYPVWWLLLVDDIGLGDSTREAAILDNQVGITHRWDRVILLSRTDSARAVEIPKLTAGSEHRLL